MTERSAEETAHIITDSDADVVEVGTGVGGSFDVSIDGLGMMITNNSKEDLESFGGVEGLAEKLHVDTKVGLTQREAADNFAERRAYFGKNTYKQPKGKSFFKLWVEALNDLTMIILIVSAIVSIILAFAVPKNIGGEVSCHVEASTSSQEAAGEEDDSAVEGIEGFAILIAVLIVSTVTAGNNYSKEKKFRALAAKESDVKVKVRRDGQIVEISIFEVNVGDVVLVDTGSQVPADGVFLRGNNVQVDESQVNGETTPSKKSADNPFFVSGCKLTDGSGEFLVVSVGDNSQWGRIMAQLQTKDQETPLQQNLDGMAKLIGVVGMTVAALTFLVLLIWWAVETARKDIEYECQILGSDGSGSGAFDPCNPIPSDASTVPYCRPINKWASAIKIVDFFITAVTIIVVAVPAGLPLAVTNSLAYSMKQMFEDKNLVRKLKACETMSNCTNICSDKTGTLTENRMTVVGSWVAGNAWTSNIRKTKKTEDDSDLTDAEKERRDAERRKKLFAEFDKQGSGCFGCCKKDVAAPADSGADEGEDVELDVAKEKVDAPGYSDTVTDILDVSFSMNSGQTSNFMVEKRKIDEDCDEIAELLVTTGNKTECALLMHLQLCGRDYRVTREKNAADVYQTFPFASARKRMSTIMWKDRKNGVLRMHIKGAPEIIMGRALYYLEDKQDGSEPAIRALTQEKRDEMVQQLQGWASQGLRTLCIGYRDFRAPTSADPINPETIGTEGIEKIECDAVKEHKKIMATMAKEAKKKGDSEGDASANVTSPLGLGPFDEPIACHEEDGVWKFDESPDSGIIIVGLMGIEDPVRPEVPPAVELCQMAGVKVRMVTGDNIMTARSIARQCKILTCEDGAIEGPVFAKLSDDEIRARLDKIDVIARCSPFDKQRLVQLLIGEGEVVAVTGDGTNDVLALKAADVGLAMGIRGTDIAKQASDIVILDDNFTSIVRSVMWGRNVYDNIRKFLQFQLTVNFAALFIVFIGAVADRGAPLKAIQLLWVNLIMDTLAALALGTEKPTGQLLNRKPFGRYDPLLSPTMIRFIVVQGLYQIAVLLVLLFAGNKMSFLGVKCAYRAKPGRFETPADGCTAAKIDADGVALQSVIFNSFVYCQVFNEINARRVNGERNVYKGMLSNPMFVGIWILIAGVQAILVIFTGPFMSVTPFPGIGWKQWITSIVLGAITLPLGLLASFIPVPTRKPRKKISEAKACCGLKPHDYNADKLADEEEERERREQAKALHEGRSTA